MKSQIAYHHSPSGKKNLRHIHITVTAQTLYHLETMAAANGWGEKDLGRVVDKLMRTALASQSNNHNRKENL